MNNGHVANPKLEALRKREQSLKSAIAAEQVKQQKRREKEHARHVTIFGACLLADLEEHPEMGTVFEQCLRRTATGRDSDYLKSKGWRL